MMPRFFVVSLLVFAGCDSIDSPPSGEPPPRDTWTYQALAGGGCGNGSEYGVAVNGGSDPNELVILLNGGGACWDATSCFALGAATHIDETLGANVVAAQAAQFEGYVFSRDPAIGPLASATFVYAPYCTGDLHSGRNVATYDVVGTPRDVHHVGAANVDAILDYVQSSMSGVERVWLIGPSAGGYGVALNWWRFADALPEATVEVIDDSGLLVDVVADRWAQMRASWSLELPPGCDGCEDGLSRLLPHYGALDLGGRFALLAFDQDAVIATYFGLEPGSIAAGLGLLAADVAESEDFQFFVVPGADHVVLANPARQVGGMTAATWIQQMVDGDPAWGTQY